MPPRAWRLIDAPPATGSGALLLPECAGIPLIPGQLGVQGQGRAPAIEGAVLCKQEVPGSIPAGSVGRFRPALSPLQSSPSGLIASVLAPTVM